MNINSMNSIVQKAMSYVAHMTPTGWLVGFVVTLLIGVACMRGFGSRSNF